jgi:hypothetical protein
MDLGAIDYFDIFIGPTGDVIYPDFTVAATEVMAIATGTDLATLLTWIVV